MLNQDQALQAHEGPDGGPMVSYQAAEVQLTAAMGVGAGVPASRSASRHDELGARAPV